jgi:hypothetical protein
MQNNTSRELTHDELALVSGGAFDLNIGPLHISYSDGCRCIDVGIGDVGVYIGPNGAGWYAGDSYGQVKW